MKKIQVFTFFAAVLFLTACSNQVRQLPANSTLETVEKSPVPIDTPPSEIEPLESSLLTAEMLKNATYSGIYDEPVTLTGGHWEGEPYMEGAASRPSVDYKEDSALFGDLDGDGLEDAVAFLVESGGGSGSFVYVAAQRNRDGQAVDAGAVLIEDRIQIKSAAIEAGQVRVEAIVPGPGDVACCPSYISNKVYTLQGGKLVEVTPEGGELARISASDLDGTSWRLLELDSGEPVLENTEITIRFEKSRLSGSGGCNDYNSSFTLSDDNPFVITIDPIVSTKKACPEPILKQEAAFFKILETISLWGYDHGQLALFYVDEMGEYNILKFVLEK